MKKIIILATSLLLVFTLTGCDDLGSYVDDEKEAQRSLGDTILFDIAGS